MCSEHEKAEPMCLVIFAAPCLLTGVQGSGLVGIKGIYCVKVIFGNIVYRN